MRYLIHITLDTGHSRRSPRGEVDDAAIAAVQARVMTPREAILAGADHIVVGRPILNAPDRRKAALAIQSEIAYTLTENSR